MSTIETFSITFIEVSAFMILWSAFNKENDKLLLKNIIIVLLTSAFVVILSRINNFISIISYVFILFIICFLHRKNIYELISELFVSLTTFITIQLLLTLFLKVIYNKNDTIYTFKNGLILNIVLLGICVFIYFLLPIEKLYKKYLLNFDIFKFLILNVIMYIIGFKVLWDYDTNLILNHMITFTMIFIFFNIINFFFYKKIIKLTEEKKVAELNSKYTPVFNNITNEAKRKQHEFKNHLNAICAICEVIDEKLLKNEIQEYIGALNYSLSDIDTIININNKILAAVIYSKLCEARNKDIKFVYSIDNNAAEFPVEEYELTEILYNLLNNAFEAIENLNLDEKLVYINIGNDGENSFIEVGNKGITIDTENISKIFKKGFSTKDEGVRGFGLYNIRKIVDSYSGKVQLSLDNGYTVFKVLF